ncbi:hypothetical protein CUS55_10925 [Enterococcus faecium]|nr:hypothetical protein CUS55_10925 [Enterococcus faecium]
MKFNYLNSFYTHHFRKEELLLSFQIRQRPRFFILATPLLGGGEDKRLREESNDITRASTLDARTKSGIPRRNET